MDDAHGRGVTGGDIDSGVEGKSFDLNPAKWPVSFAH